MSKEVFRNYDKKAIKSLIREMGKERFDCAIKDSGMESRPLTMEGFFIEFQPDKEDFILYYMYPSRVVFKIISVLGFWAVPDSGWVKERIGD
ncbi:hypothetical protein [Flagellimonas sp. CMM7]|uniref:hypothetical protein n=1 Tax=Flagellimonas sp. CMM7 TaxID=2654676 RepID=UPI0013D855D8|nr:hypothetical protein [Flagellimonas sp. CMM7]UII79987.1 hypothetical protein LV704_00350 [Flagellimonas sp. CMM7]